ncbi:MAG: hypothetical protein KDD60_12095, partial [Bdellovibrionales bacterium]|nr:hypothetical protein [Bdellovibrionales bacterium]
PYEDFPNLPGAHFRRNMAFAFSLAKELGIDEETACRAARKFCLPAHRIERIGSINDVLYINDSSATIPEATVHALHCFPNTSTIIFGGYDRRVDLSLLEHELESIDNINIIALPDTGHTIAQKILQRSPHMTPKIHFAQTLTEAVELSYSLCPSGTTCLFSPAAASYHQFTNYQERGDLFRSLIQSHSNWKPNPTLE